MPEIVLCLFIIAIIRAFQGRLLGPLANFMQKRRNAAKRPLCVDCGSAHVQYAANAKRAISCTFGGGVRTISIDVLYCTDYSDRNVLRRTTNIGFVREIESADLAEVTVCKG